LGHLNKGRASSHARIGDDNIAPAKIFADMRIKCIEIGKAGGIPTKLEARSRRQLYS